MFVGEAMYGVSMRFGPLFVLGMAALVPAKGPKDPWAMELGSVGPMMRNQLIAAISDPQSAKARALAIRLAKRMGASDKPYPSSDVDVFECGGTDWESRPALNFLARRRPSVFRRMLDDPSINVRAELLGSLARAKSPQDFPIVLRFAQSRNTTIQIAGISCFKYLTGPGARETALHASLSSHNSVRLAAADALGRWKDTEVQAALQRLAEDFQGAISGTAKMNLGVVISIEVLRRKPKQ